MLLSDSKIRNTKPGIKPIRVRDGNGLYIVVRPNGRKYWQFRYTYLEKEKTVSLGQYPGTSLFQARKKRVEAEELLGKGKDPSFYKKQEKAKAIFANRNSFGLIAQEWLDLNQSRWSPKYMEKTLCRMNTHLLPHLSDRPITMIEPLELLSLIQRIEKQGLTEMSHRILRIAGAVFDYAIITGRAKVNISTGLSKALRPYRPTHHPALTGDEIPTFLDALKVLDTSGQNKVAIKLLLLTALRTGELRHSKWTHVDFDERIWRIPAENTKMRTEHIVPLSNQSMGLLKELRDISGDSEWLFPNSRKQVHPVMSENTINNMIHRMGYKGRLVGHGFRSMFSTILNENGFNRDAIERQLAHMERNKVRAAYNRAEYLPERREMMQWWADFIASQKPENAATMQEKKTVTASNPTEKEMVHSANSLYPFCGTTLH